MINNHMYFNNNIYGYINNIWELSSDEIYFNFDNITLTIINFEIYNYLIENINKHIGKLNNMLFLNCKDSNIKKFIKPIILYFILLTIIYYIQM